MGYALGQAKLNAELQTAYLSPLLQTTIRPKSLFLKCENDRVLLLAQLTQYLPRLN